MATAVGIEDGSFIMTSWRGVQTSSGMVQISKQKHLYTIINILCAS
jgi:hypothetical protein